MRGLLALAASALAGLAGTVASLDRDADIVPFFIGLTFLGGIGGWAAHAGVGVTRTTARAVALIWSGAAVWVGVLLVWSSTLGVGPEPPPEATYAGLTATVYHLVGLYGGAALMLVSAYGNDRWLERARRSASPADPGGHGP